LASRCASSSITDTWPVEASAGAANSTTPTPAATAEPTSSAAVRRPDRRTYFTVTFTVRL
jgi:hypothetical protein